MYDKDYVVFDDFGIKEVRCTKCNTLVAMRDLLDVGGKPTLALRRLSNWRQVKIELNNGTYAEPIFCGDCAEDIDPTKTLDQIKKGWELALRANGLDHKTITEKVTAYAKLAVKTELKAKEK